MTEDPSHLKVFSQDFASGLAVFSVALPLCLGIALASNAPLLSGIVAGVVGGVVVAWLSGSHTSISGPAAGLTAVVATQIQSLGSFDAFLVAVILAGVIQIGLAALNAGSLAAFFPSSVIKGLLAGIGVILILKQIPHLFGHDPDWLGDMHFLQRDGHNTFTELIGSFASVHPGATLIGLTCLLLLVTWDKTPLRRLPVPAPLAVVFAGVAMALGLAEIGGIWAMDISHLVQVPASGSVAGRLSGLPSPDFASFGPQATNVLFAAMTIAIVASLETLLNLEAIDKLDPQKRVSPPNRELLAQGVGNMTSGFLGGLPVTSVIARSAVGIDSGGRTRMTAFTHGLLLLVLVMALPGLLNEIPLSCLAAILFVTGLKLASPSLMREMWQQGHNQFLPFIGTVLAILFTDLLLGTTIGLIIATAFILRSNLQSPLRKIHEHHVSGEVLRLEFANQVTFLNRAALLEALHEIPRGAQVVLDARATTYMDPDIIDLVREFETEIAPAHALEVSLLGFKDHYDQDDRVTYVDMTTREIQDEISPDDVLRVMLDGNERFVSGQQIMRDPRRQVGATSSGQYPLAVVLACMDSRIATEMVFDLGLGDIFSVRVAGNIASAEGIGSIEYGCAAAGAKLVLVLGHTRCGAIAASIDRIVEGPADTQEPGPENLALIVDRIGKAVLAEPQTKADRNGENDVFVERVTALNVRLTMRNIQDRSATLRDLIDRGRIRLVGAIYEVETGRVRVLDSERASLGRASSRPSIGECVDG